MTVQQADPAIDATERVSMVWPAELKATVRQLVGSRGLTDFTLDAVRDKLGQLDRTSEPDLPDERPDEPVADNTIGHALQARKAELDSIPNPVEVAKLPLVERMRYARDLIERREGPGAVTTAGGVCSKCGDELVNDECWTCLPT
jgi:hypothetical protein